MPFGWFLSSALEFPLGKSYLSGSRRHSGLCPENSLGAIAKFAKIQACPKAHGSLVYS